MYLELSGRARRAPALLLVYPLACAALLVAPAGCGGTSPPSPDAGPVDAGPSFPATPLATVNGDLGVLRFELRTSPQPPTRGQNAALLNLTDLQGAPQPGLSVQVQPWMAEMGHGSAVTPQVTDLDGGAYRVDDIELAMPGAWQLRLTVSGRLSDHAAPELQIP